jgi:2,5-diketo-D-gluconate reductase B
MVNNIPTRNGIPQLGLGTYPLGGQECVDTVRMAIDLGYRHIDTAQMYRNEADVGRAIADCGVAREKLFIVTKVDPSNLRREAFAKSVQRSVKDLGGPVDLLLIHWPPAEDKLPEMLDHLLAEKDRGHAVRIGVSNFSPRLLSFAQQHTGGAIVNNQVEFHPLLDQHLMVSAAEKQNVALSAYSPLARGVALKPEAVQGIARRLDRPASEIVLRWILQQGVIAIPMTTKRANAQSNLRALDFTLSVTDMDTLSKLGTTEGRTVAPGWMDGRWD